MSLSKAQQRRRRRALIKELHRKAFEQGRLRDIGGMGGKPGRWGYSLDADADVAKRCCPLCFRPYADYEVSALSPCWRCRDKRELEECGSLCQDATDWGAMAGYATPLELDRFNDATHGVRVASRLEVVEKAEDALAKAWEAHRVAPVDEMVHRISDIRACERAVTQAEKDYETVRSGDELVVFQRNARERRRVKRERVRATYRPMARR